MRRLLRILLALLLIAVLLPIVLIGAALVFVNTQPGARLIEREANALTGGMVQLFGVAGAFPSAPRIGRIEIHDADGLWLSIEDAALDWSPSRLLSRMADASSLTARRIAVLRLPKSSGGSSSSGGGFSLPVRVEIRHVAVARIDIAAPVAGTPLALSLDGSAQARALDQFGVDAQIRDLDANGAYRASLALTPAAILAKLEADEPAHGAVARAAGLPDLGALSLRASLDGPRTAAATHVTLAAGPLHLGADGQIDMDGMAATLDVIAKAPAMTLAPGLSFSAVDLAAHVAGKLSAPEATGHLTIDDLARSGASVRRLAAELSGSLGKVAVRASAEGVRLPGPKPELIEADPLHASVEATLSAADKPFLFTVSHPLLAISGNGHLAPALSLAAHVTAPELAPFAAMGGVDLHGDTALDVTVKKEATTSVTLDGTLGLTSGPGPAAALIGKAATIGVTAEIGSDVEISRLTVAGAALRVAATGHAGSRIAADATVELPDLKAVAATLGGRAKLRATAQGTPTDLALNADLEGDVATSAVPAGHVAAHVQAQGLPGAPTGRVTAEGQLDGASLNLDARAARSADGATKVTIDRADWRSAHAEGALALAPGATLPTGNVAFRMTRLDDLRRLAGVALSGAVQGTVDLADKLATAQISAERAGIPGNSVERATLDARVADPLAEARVDAKLVASGIQASGTRADATVTVTGPRTALDIRADAKSPALGGGPASVATRAVLDADRRTVAIASLEAVARGQTLRLLAPARVSFGDTVAVDRLRLGLRDAVIDIAGRASPTLDLTVSLRNLHPDIASVIDPGFAADGTISADAKLTGTPARPSGTVRLDVSGLHMRGGPGRALPPLFVTANAALAGQQARIDATMHAGSNQLTVTGTAPIDPKAAVDLHAKGGIDLAVLDPLVAGSGRRVRGKVAIDAGLAGTMAAPVASGTVRLVGGEVQDFAQGLRLDHIEALIAASGDSVRIDHLDARAGAGTISAAGTVGLGGLMPADLRLTARHATPLASDLLTALLDADLTVRGTLQQRLDLGGRIVIKHAEIRVPERLPSSVPLLNVVQPGAKPPPPPAPPLLIGLDVTVASPGQIFVRGQGIDAELAGDLHVGGTSAQPQPTGGFTMRRGSLSVAGKTLTFSTGKVGFNGSGSIDPSLDFVANSISGNVTATLTVSGTASNPKIVLSSVPELPQDEVLARLLFGQSAASLGPFQLAEIAAALAQLTGAGGGGFDPLNSIRNGLGLDRLSVGGGGSGTSPNVEAGKYVAQGVYVGARQATSGGGTQAVVQVDITKGLKLESTAGTGGGSAQGAAQSGAQSSGTGVGLTYQFEY